MHGVLFVAGGVAAATVSMALPSLPLTPQRRRRHTPAMKVLLVTVALGGPWVLISTRKRVHSAGLGGKWQWCWAWVGWMAWLPLPTEF